MSPERGFVATTNPGGANGWRSEYAEFLRGCEVILIPDKQEEIAHSGAQTAARASPASSVPTDHAARGPELAWKPSVADAYCNYLERSGNALQQRPVNTGGRLVKHARYYWLMLAESYLTRQLFGSTTRKAASKDSSGSMLAWGRAAKMEIPGRVLELRNRVPAAAREAGGHILGATRGR